MPKELYMLDTINAKKIYDNFIGPLDLNYYHTFNCYFPFTAIKNVIKVVSIPSDGLIEKSGV